MLKPAKNQGDINAPYKKAGLKPPKGKGIHTIKFHKCAVAIASKNPKLGLDAAYPICMKKLGRNASVNRSHWR